MQTNAIRCWHQIVRSANKWKLTLLLLWYFFLQMVGPSNRILHIYRYFRMCVSLKKVKVFRRFLNLFGRIRTLHNGTKSQHLSICWWKGTFGSMESTDGPSNWTWAFVSVGCWSFGPDVQVFSQETKNAFTIPKWTCAPISEYKIIFGISTNRFVLHEFFLLHIKSAHIQDRMWISCGTRPTLYHVYFFFFWFGKTCNCIVMLYVCGCCDGVR